jgi:hypothetical protein
LENIDASLKRRNETVAVPGVENQLDLAGREPGRHRVCIRGGLRLAIYNDILNDQWDLWIRYSRTLDA